MYVLADLEWIVNEQKVYSLTQIAAIRVDENWNTLDTFSSLARPKEQSFWQWHHVAFSGWCAEDFRSAPSFCNVMSRFSKWLRADDEICWWHQDSKRYFEWFCSFADIDDEKMSAIELRDYVYRYLSPEKEITGNPYQLCDIYGIPACGIMHCALNDAVTMQKLLQGIGFPQPELLIPLEKKVGISANKNITAPYRYDEKTQLLHREDCSILQENIVQTKAIGLQRAVKQRYRPCACCRKDYRTVVADKMKEQISRTRYNYVYLKTSPVFHTRDCRHILSSYEILGTETYEKVVATGRVPCRHCQPAPITRPQKPRKKNNPAAYHFSRVEKNAIARFQQAKKERERAFKESNLTEHERRNVLALTQPSCAFWAATGYQTFHLRNCKKLVGLGELKGFSRYHDAVQAGYAPCRHCHPSSKQDMIFSIPITSETRSWESTDTLTALCREHQLPYRCEGKFFYLQTNVGKWRIDTSGPLIHLAHINLVYTPENTDQYHVQPRLFLSYQDTVSYILRHDSTLERKRSENCL